MDPDTDLDEDANYGTHWLLSAVRRRDSLHVVRRIVELHPELAREPDRLSGEVALHEAMFHGHPRDFVAFLHRCWPGAVRHVAAAGCRPGLPLHSLSCRSRLESVAFLIDMYPEGLGIKNSKGMTPLQVGLDIGAPMEIIKLMLDRRPESIREPADDGRLPVHFAAAPEINGPKVALLRYVVRKWPQAVHERADDGLLPVHHAIRYGADRGKCGTTKKIVRILLELLPGPGHDQDGTGTATRSGMVHFAIKFATRTLEYVKVVARAVPESLLAPNSRGMLPVHVAVARCGHSNKDLVRTLAELRPESLLVPNARGDLALHMAMFKNCVAMEELAGILLEHCPESLRVPGEGGRLPVHAAVSQSYPSLELVRLLVEPSPESLRAKDGEGNVPLILAASNPTTSLEVVHYLLATCPDVLGGRNAAGRPR